MHCPYGTYGTLLSPPHVLFPTILYLITHPHIALTTFVYCAMSFLYLVTAFTFLHRANAAPAARTITTGRQFVSFDAFVMARVLRLRTAPFRSSDVSIEQ